MSTLKAGHHPTNSSEKSPIRQLLRRSNRCDLMPVKPNNPGIPRRFSSFGAGDGDSFFKPWLPNTAVWCWRSGNQAGGTCPAHRLLFSTPISDALTPWPIGAVKQQVDEPFDRGVQPQSSGWTKMLFAIAERTPIKRAHTGASQSPLCRLARASRGRRSPWSSSHFFVAATPWFPA